MQIKAKLLVPILSLLTIPLVHLPTYGAGASEVESLVRGFPTLDDLETHLGFVPPPEDTNPYPRLRVQANSRGAEGFVFPVSARWFTAPPAPDPFGASALAPHAEPGEKPLASLLADMDAAQKESRALGKEIVRQNNLPINKYLFDRITTYARTDYGTDITGLFVNGIGFGSLQQTLRQNYGAEYTLPLLRRFSGSTKWTRILSGWTISSSVSAMPALSQVLQLQQFLNNLQLSW